MEYEISLHQVELLITKGYTLADFIEQTVLANQLSKKKKLLYEKITKALPFINSASLNESVYKLAAAGLSIKNINLLREHNICYQDIENLTYSDFMETLKSTSSKEAVFQRIKTAFERVEEAFQIPPSIDKIYDSLLIKLFDSLPPRKFISKLEIKLYLLRSLHGSLHVDVREIDENAIEVFLEKNIEKGLILSSDLGFAKKYIKFIDYLEVDFKDKDILIQKLNNATLQDIADEQKVSRERIRQKLSKVLSNLPLMEEIIIYRESFEQYDWPEELFNMIFKEHPYVYQFLKLSLKKGTKDILKHLDELSLDLNERNTVLTYFNYYVNYENQIMPYSNKIALFEHLVYNLGEVAVHYSEFIEIANEFIIEKELTENLLFDERNVIGLADRSNRVIRTNKQGFRYYNLSNLETFEINQLKQLLNLGPGIYSTAKLFNENIDLMNELNIDSEYELHNIYKKIIDVPHVEYTRMPEFSVGQVSKEEFLIVAFHELAPISIDEFVSYIEENYGLKSASVRSLIYTDYISYIHENMIVVDHPPVTELELVKFKQLLTKDIYTIEELVKIGQTLDVNFRNKFINNHTLLKVGYYIRGMFVLNEKYNSIEQYFTEHIMQQDVFHNTRSQIYQTTSFMGTLYELERSLDAIRIERDLYITSTKLEAANLTKGALIGYRDTVYAYVSQMEYFTLPQIRLAGFSHPLEDYGFSDLFYERIIWSNPLIQSIHTSSHIIFSTSLEETNLTKFIKYLISNYIKVDIYKFMDILQREYGLNLKLYKLIDIVNNSSMHYSAEMECFYLNTNAFYEDIY